MTLTSQDKSAAGMQNISATGYFKCKENHFETRPFHAKFVENRLRNAKDSENPIYNVNQGP